jgi:bifunctional DNA-binding transcriptional regulator/antitoxin component of YhaV-PrlF toxin-antitoxin module
MPLRFDGEGCIPIPDEMLDALGLDLGAELDVRISGRAIVVTRAEDEGLPFIGWGPPDVRFIAAAAHFAEVDLPGLAASIDEGIAEMESGFIEGLRQGLASHASVAARLDRVIAAVLDAFQDRTASRAWLLRPHPLLGWRSPIASAMTEEGAREVEGLLGRLMSGVAV